MLTTELEARIMREHTASSKSSMDGSQSLYRDTATPERCSADTDAAVDYERD